MEPPEFAARRSQQAARTFNFTCDLDFCCYPTVRATHNGTVYAAECARQCLCTCVHVFERARLRACTCARVPACITHRAFQRQEGGIRKFQRALFKLRRSSDQNVHQIRKPHITILGQTQKMSTSFRQGPYYIFQGPYSIFWGPCCTSWGRM